MSHGVPAELTQSSPRQLLREAVAQLRRQWRPLLVLQIGFKVVAFLLLSPLVAAVLNMLLARGGTAAIGNLEIVAFVLTVPGVLALLVLPALALAIIYAEQSTTLALLQQDFGGKGTTRASIISAARYVVFHLPALLRLALVHIFCAMALALPFVLLLGLTYWLLLGGVDINYYLDARPPRFYAALAIGGIIALAALAALAWLYVRWFFSLPLVLLEGHAPRPALAISAELTHSRRRMIISAIVIWLSARWLMFLIVTAAMTTLTGLVLYWTRGQLTLAIWTAGAMLLVNGAAFALAAAIDRIIYATLMKLLFRAAVAYAPPPVREHIREHHDEAPLFSGRRGALIIAATTLAVVLVAGYATSSVAEMTRRQPVVVTAHRAGALLGPENSLSALEASIAAGAHWAEIDVQLSADGTVWVVHDKDLRRAAGSPLEVAQASDAELSAARLRGPDGTTEPLPTLQQMLDIARGRIRLSIELKYYGFDPRLVEAVLDLVRANDMLSQIAMISLDYQGLEQTRRLAPDVRRGYLVSARIGDITRLDVDFLSVSKTNLNPRLRAQASARGLDLAVWTTNEHDEMLRLMARGADDLVTDDPAIARKAIDDFAALSDVELILLRVRELLER